MLTHDTAAFVEQIAVPRPDKRGEKLVRQAASAELEAVHVSVELRLAEEALKRLDDPSAGGAGATSTRLFGFRRHHSTAAREAHARSVAELRDRLHAQRAHVQELERAVQELDATRPHNTWYRLHSEQHHTTYSVAQFERMAATQRARPVLLTRTGGRSWWWYLDRFWWDDERLDMSEVRSRILERDRASMRESEAHEHARAIAVGDRRPPAVEAERVLSESARAAARWRDEQAR